MSLAENIIATWERSTTSDLEGGMLWYESAHAIALELSPNDVRMGAGVIASLSPVTGWDYNVVNARRTFANGYASGTLGTSVRKADAILAGTDPRLALGKGKKVRSFYENILDPMCDAVTIDRHAYDVAVGSVTDDKTRSALGRVGVYEKFADAYREAGRTLGVVPSQVQAVTWVTWRNEKNAEKSLVLA